MVKRSKTLGAFRETLAYQAEARNGLRRGYLASFVWEVFKDGLHYDIGQPWNKNKTAREHIEWSCKAWRWATLQQIAEHRKSRNRSWRWTGDEHRNELARQLIGLRMFRARVKEELVKGDTILREQGKIP